MRTGALWPLAPALAGALAASACGSGATERTPSDPAPTGTSDPVNLVQDQIPVGGQPIGIASGEGSIWVVNSEFESGGRGSVTRVDPETGEVLGTIEVGRVPLKVAVGEDGVWVSNSEDDTVSRLDPATGEVLATIEVCAAPEGLAIGGGSVWVVCEDDGAVGRIDPATDELAEAFDVGLQPRFALFAFGSVWVSDYLGNTITRLDPQTGEVLAEVETAPGPQIMLEVDDRVWVSCTDSALVQQVDSTTQEVVAETSTPPAPDGLALDSPFTVWVATAVGPQVMGIDVADGSVLVTAQVADEGFINANQVVILEWESLWLPILGRDVVLRVRPAVKAVE